MNSQEGKIPLVLVVDDDEEMRDLLEVRLSKLGYEVECAESGETALEMLTRIAPDAMLLDLNMPGIGGPETLIRVRASHRFMPVVALTAEGDTSTVVTTVRDGAFDFLVKPVDKEELRATLGRAVEHHRASLLELQNNASPAEFGIIGSSVSIQRLQREIRRVGASDVSVYIRGESGTGKELVANGIHAASARGESELIAVNCAAIPDALQESEFFGHEKGAFTGASVRHDGFFARANGGTLFLDEVAELTLPLQAKILRVLQERTYRRVGGREELATDFRLIVATHRQLLDEVQAGKFREDLYYRIVVYEIEVLALRKRREDIPVLANHFFNSESRDEAVPLISEPVRQAMNKYHWPGNVRELKNAVLRALVSHENGTVKMSDLPPTIRVATPYFSAEGPAEDDENEKPRLTMAEIERRAILDAMRLNENNRALVCQQLGIGRTTLYRKLKEYGLGEV